MWYNRVVMGLIVDLSRSVVLVEDETRNSVLRGFIIGFLISTAIYLSTTFRDIPSFFAGLVYGVIIDVVATRYG